MKKNLLFVLLLFACSSAFSQIQSITPNSAYQGQTLMTTISMASGLFSTGSPPFNSSDIYLQRGTDIIYTYAGYSSSNIFWGTDSLWTNFTIPLNAADGYYDVHIITWDTWSNSTDWVLTNGFYVGSYAGSVEGNVYFDANQNGVKDGGEIPLRNHKIFVNPGNIQVNTNNQGYYKAYVDSGSYSVTYQPNIGYFLTSSPGVYNHTMPPSYTGDDFGSYSLQSYYNQYFTTWHNRFRCGPWVGETYIHASNQGTIPVQGSITMIHSPNLIFTSSTPMPDAVSGDTLRWNYTSLAAGSVFTVYPVLFQNPPSGQTVWFTAIDSVLDMSGNVMTQYSDSFYTITTCSFDPNDKWVSPPGIGSQHYTPPNTDLTYTINFQNTGSDTAFNIKVLDTLDANLDWSTFEIIYSTHNVFSQIAANGEVTFTFENIMLPDSNVDEPGSHGTVIYKIRTDSLLPDPTVISNTAYIYFDYNAPVVTNTVFNTITSLQYPAASFVLGDVSLCPGSCVGFTNISANGTSYQWSFPGGLPSSSTSANPSNICYTNPGNFDVQLIATNALGSDTVNYPGYIEVYPLGAQAIVQSGDTLFANQGFVSYIWYYNGNIINGATDYYYVATQNGDYNVISFDGNGCDIEAVAYNVMVGIADLQLQSVHIFPNPVKNIMHIQNVNGAEISIFNLLGDKVMHLLPDASLKHAAIDVSEFSKGVYMVELKSGSQLYHVRVIVE